MARLTEITEEICLMLSEITEFRGYEVTMGSINEPDQALVQYPTAEVTYSQEEADTSVLNALYGHAVVTYQIKIRGALDAMESRPVWAIDEEYDKIITAIKRKFSEAGGELALIYNPVIMYQGFSKVVARSGDVFVPGHVIMTYKVRYQFQE